MEKPHKLNNKQRKGTEQKNEHKPYSIPNEGCCSPEFSNGCIV